MAKVEQPTLYRCPYERQCACIMQDPCSGCETFAEFMHMGLTIEEVWNNRPANWISVEDRLPDKDTRYAARYGVGVLVYDEKEAEASGYFHPSRVSFNFENQKFETMAYGPKGSFVIEAFWVSHWMEMPLTPDLINKEGE